MANLSLRISITEKNTIKTMQFDPSLSVYDVCILIRQKISEANLGQTKDYGLFLADEDSKKGVWLEPGRNLHYYILRNGDLLEYRRKLRTLKVRTMDGTLKTMLVDDSQLVANLMVVICIKIGITNYDEYSLARENPGDEVENKLNISMLSLKGKKANTERDLKMEQLRKKLKTDDEVNWVNPNKTLREQGINELEQITLKRKFFFSDQNIDSSDPVQLNLLYVQTRDAIIKGTHPITQEMACQLAGIQCHIQFGNYNEAKHNLLLNLKEFLPEPYVKTKGIEKKISAEHSKYVRLLELNAKCLYTKTARSLKTYGVTFFLVKEKMKGRNRLIPRILGVTKDSVLRLDERTKEILKTWPLTTVRRWGASPNTFTLDFGDYCDQYYSVQTNESEQILQLISGYIDIILKKKESKDHFGMEGDEGLTMVEDSVSPLKATILQHESNVEKVDIKSVFKPTILRIDSTGKQFENIEVTSVLSESQLALLKTISVGHQTIITVEKELITKVKPPELGTDPFSLKWKEITVETNRNNAKSQLAIMNVGTAEVVAHISGSVNPLAMNTAISTITSTLPEMSRSVRMLLLFMDDDASSDQLLDATQKLCRTLSDLLETIKPAIIESHTNLLNAAGRVGEASQQLLTEIGEYDKDKIELQNNVLRLAKSMANTTATLVHKAKNALNAMTEEQQHDLTAAITQCVMFTSQLVVCAKIVAPTLQTFACQDQLMQVIKNVKQALKCLVAITNDGDLVLDLNRDIAEVTQTLDHLQRYIKNSGRETGKESIEESYIEQVLIATDMLFASTSAGEMIHQTRTLVQATAQLIQELKDEVEVEPNSESRHRLLSAVKALAEATTRMIGAARQCTSSPYDTNKQQYLRKTVEDFKAATKLAATSALQKKIIYKLEVSLEQAVNMAIQCIASAKEIADDTGSKTSQVQLMADSKLLAGQIPLLLQEMKEVIHDNPTIKLNLINVSKQFIQISQRLVVCSRTVLPTISDQPLALQLCESSQALAVALSELTPVIGRAQIHCTELQLEAAHNLVCNLRDELVKIQYSINNGHFPAWHEETSKSHELGSSTKNVRRLVVQISAAVTHGNRIYTESVTHDMVNELKDLTGFVKTSVADAIGKETQLRIVTRTHEVMEWSLIVIDETKTMFQELFNDEKLTETIKRIIQALSDLSGQYDIDDAVTYITTAISVLDARHFSQTDIPYYQLLTVLRITADILNEASEDVVAYVESPNELATAAEKLGFLVGDVIHACMQLAGEISDSEIQEQMIVTLHNVSEISSKLLITAKAAAANPSAFNIGNQLGSLAKMITCSMRHLVDVCTSAAPDQKECDNAISIIQSLKPLLDHPSKSMNDATYIECLDTIMEKSKSLGDAIIGIVTHAKLCKYELFNEYVRKVSNSIRSLIESAAQVAYLLVISNSKSTANLSLIDQVELARVSQAIQDASSTLHNDSSNQQQILIAATIIIQHTGVLCSICRTASSEATNSVTKRYFDESSKSVANLTIKLVKEINNALGPDSSDKNCKSCFDIIHSLLDSINSLVTFIKSSEYTNQPECIEATGANYKPITSSGCEIIDASCSIICVMKSLIVAPKNRATWKLLESHNKSVFDSMKKLVASIRENSDNQWKYDTVIVKLGNFILDLDQASLLARLQRLSPGHDTTLEELSVEAVSAASEITDHLDALNVSNKLEAENNNHSVKQMIPNFKPLVSSSIDVASNMMRCQPETVLRDQSKTVLGCTMQLMSATKKLYENPEVINMYSEVDECIDITKDAASVLDRTLQQLTTQMNVTSGLLKRITGAMTKVPNQNASQDQSFINLAHPYGYYHTKMIITLKEIARLAQEMIINSCTDVKLISSLTAQLTNLYAQVAGDSAGAIAAIANPELGSRVAMLIQELGYVCQNIVHASYNISYIISSSDTLVQCDISESSHTLHEKVAQVLAVLQTNFHSYQAYMKGTSTISSLIGDLDTTILFATTGVLHPENKTETFEDHREYILKPANALFEDTKTLVAESISPQKQLAVATENAISKIVQLANVVKSGADTLRSNNPENQIILINRVIDVASALGELIKTTEVSFGKTMTDTSISNLKDSAKVMVTSITSLLNTVNATEGEDTENTYALESTTEVVV